MLPHTVQLLLFVTAATALIASPGPAVVYVVARSLDQGRLAGLVSAWGVVAGAQLQVAAAAFGAAALIVQSPLAFQVVKLLGAVYLIYLGIRRLRENDSPDAIAHRTRQPLRRVFAEGLLVSLLNPKSGLFLMAFLPQFIDPAKGRAATQIFLLGAVYLLICIVIDSLYALAAGSLSAILSGRRGFVKAQRYVTGGVYLGLGLLAAVSGADGG